MPPPSPRKDLSLRALELFQLCAQKGSLQAASQEAGLSISTISHHLRSLEDHLGVALFDHSRRPMVLTPRGAAFLRNIDEALYAIRRAKADAAAGNVAEMSHLRLGTIEDFDSDIMPELAVFLSRSMPHCDLSFHTDSSHTLIDMLRNRKLDLGIASSPAERTRDLLERPFLQDPFVAILPIGVEESPGDITKGQSDLPLLRFSGNLFIAQQIETHLRRLGISSPRGFESSNNQTLLAMVASGAGWAISTPLLFSRARRFHPKVRMHSFPGQGFSRTLSMVATPDCSNSVLDLIDHKLRHLITTHALGPVHAGQPWLKDHFKLLG